MIDVVIPCRGDLNTVVPITETFRKHWNIRSIIVVVNGEPYVGTRILPDSHDILYVWSQAQGKGEAVKAGLDLVETDRVIFCDADLTGLRYWHVQILARPFDGMIVGIPDRPVRMPVPWPVPDNVWQLVSGERSLPTDVARSVDLHGYAMEVQLNHEIRKRGLPVTFRHLHGVTGKVRENSRRMEELRRDQRWLAENWKPS